MRLLSLVGCVLLVSSFVHADDAAWIDLVSDKASEVWKSDKGWLTVGTVALEDKNPRRLQGEPGKGILLNGKGRERDLVTKQSFGDVEVELEFCISKGSNSGVKFHSLYEIQIIDSFGSKKELDGDTCGGIYPRAELLPKYTYLDKGVAPKSNACKAPGEWQKLTAIFVAPRFDNDGKKVQNAKIVKATLNGTLIHENVEMKTPTGHNWTKKEVATAPLLLQGDHGPVAFRNVRVRPFVK